MRAFVITGPGRAEVQEVEPPVPGPGEVVVEVERAGVCGTDMEFYSGAMTYLRTGEARYPVRIGHEWAGVVREAGDGVDPAWLGRRVTGDTMLGCGGCARCLGGRQHLCAGRYEIGIRNGWPGALAERLPVPVRALQPLPGAVDPVLGALVEPGGNALRAVDAAALGPGERLLVIGPGTIGLLAALTAAARGVEVHLLGLPGPALDFARSLGFTRTWTGRPELTFDGVIDASNGRGSPALAVEAVEPGRRVVLIGLSAERSDIDTRGLVLGDITAVGILSASGGLAGAAELYASGLVDPRPLVAATVPLEEAALVLAGRRRPEWGSAPKIHVDPRPRG
ncbi:threonine dehydrogenase-like Zn-dependent dehydrogenase [Nonomuraea thailandensis]|uniref:Threonine dehydrogenase-like Zn-dependent dehydrogenase n=1 Tax=Nonomuraea thailandensis TaxID=1188745 RepID=A0A9X2K2U6_9ACTN|nr:alcohol dehydrogenase catalytic domain-containing protein [Nonomuraea thailandensis]MCP2358822.1 threonine dehydrogenase-like Zn-dependent dehydrogenase [Nonomuraea thailandensis]